MQCTLHCTEQCEWVVNAVPRSVLQSISSEVNVINPIKGLIPKNLQYAAEQGTAPRPTAYVIFF